MEELPRLEVATLAVLHLLVDIKELHKEDILGVPGLRHKVDIQEELHHQDRGDIQEEEELHPKVKVDIQEVLHHQDKGDIQGVPDLRDKEDIQEELHHQVKVDIQEPDHQAERPKADIQDSPMEEVLLRDSHMEVLPLQDRAMEEEPLHQVNNQLEMGSLGTNVVMWTDEILSLNMFYLHFLFPQDKLIPMWLSGSMLWTKTEVDRLTPRNSRELWSTVTGATSAKRPAG